MALISGGADKPGYHHQRPRARRGRAAFLAIKARIKAETIIPAERSYLVPPTATSDGVTDWLNTKIYTSDVIALCAVHGWRVRFGYPRPSPAGFVPVAPTMPVAATAPPAGAPDRIKVIEFLSATTEEDCDEAVGMAKKTFGIHIGQNQGRDLWKEAGRRKRPGRPPIKITKI